MYTVWVKRSNYWEKLPYAARGRYEASKLAASYRRKFPQYEYELAPSGFNPAFAYVGR